MVDENPLFYPVNLSIVRASNNITIGNVKPGMLRPIDDIPVEGTQNVDLCLGLFM